VFGALYMIDEIGGAGLCENEDRVVAKMIQKIKEHNVPRSFMPDTVWQNLDNPDHSNPAIVGIRTEARCSLWLGRMVCPAWS
jgi:hypothetical protein